MRTLFDNYTTNVEAELEYFKDYCEANEIEFPADAENSNEFYEWQSESLAIAWDDLINEIENDKDSNVICVVTGSLGLWHGRRDIEPKVFPSLKSAINECVANMDYVILTEDEGVIKVEAIHHDGRNNFEIHKLNKKGFIAYCNDEDFNNEECYEKFDIKF